MNCRLSPDRSLHSLVTALRSRLFKIIAIQVPIFFGPSSIKVRSEIRVSGIARLRGSFGNGV